MNPAVAAALLSRTTPAKKPEQPSVPSVYNPGFPRWIDVLPVPCAEFGSSLRMLAGQRWLHYVVRDG